MNLCGRSDCGALFPHSHDSAGTVWGKDIPGCEQIHPGVYVAEKSRSVFHWKQAPLNERDPSDAPEILAFLDEGARTERARIVRRLREWAQEHAAASITEDGDDYDDCVAFELRKAADTIEREAGK